MFYELAFQLMYMSIIAGFVGFVWWGALRLLDKGAGVKFKDAIAHIRQDRLALSIYFSARLIATAILFAPLLRLIF